MFGKFSCCSSSSSSSCLPSLLRLIHYLAMTTHVPVRRPIVNLLVMLGPGGQSGLQVCLQVRASRAFAQATVKAVGPTTLLVLRRDAFERLCGTHPQTAQDHTQPRTMPRDDSWPRHQGQAAALRHCSDMQRSCRVLSGYAAGAGGVVAGHPAASAHCSRPLPPRA